MQSLKKKLTWRHLLVRFFESSFFQISRQKIFQVMAAQNILWNYKYNYCKIYFKSLWYECDKKWNYRLLGSFFFNSTHPSQSFFSKTIPDINKRFFAMCSQVNLWYVKFLVFFVVNRFTGNWCSKTGLHFFQDNQAIFIWEDTFRGSFSGENFWHQLFWHVTPWRVSNYTF